MAQDLDARFAEAVEARENLRETDKKETRIFVQTHPDLLVIPPDPPQMMIKVDQVRHVIQRIYYRPAEARESVYIFTGSAFMKEAANSLLKVLEEPPEFATIFLLTENAGELLPTIRSRSAVFTLGALAATEIEAQLAKLRPDWNSRQRALVARLSEGAMGRARSFDLEGYIAARGHALVMLKSALGTGDHSDLFKTTETYRPGADGRAEDGRSASDALSAAGRPDVPAIGSAATGAEHRHPGRTEKNVGSGRFCLGATRRPRAWARWSADCAAICCGRCRSTHLQLRSSHESGLLLDTARNLWNPHFGGITLWWY